MDMKSYLRGWKQWLSATLVLAVVLVLLGLKMCATFPKRDLAFEEKIETFAKAKKPESKIQLFNGENLGGWEAHGLGRWTVDEGVLTVKRGIGYLSTRCEQFDNFILSLDIRVSKKGNSGVFFRSPHAKGLWPWPKGYESQVDNHDPKNPTGSLYDRVKASKLITQDEEWFNMQVKAIGQDVTVRINDQIVTSATDVPPTPSFIALQAHDPFCRVDFKNIWIEIPPDINTD